MSSGVGVYVALMILSLQYHPDVHHTCHHDFDVCSLLYEVAPLPLAVITSDGKAALRELARTASSMEPDKNSIVSFYLRVLLFTCCYRENDRITVSASNRKPEHRQGYTTPCLSF